MVRIRVNDGTRSTNKPSICGSCRYGQIIKGTKESEDIVRCAYICELIKIHVTDCSIYVPRSGMSMDEMYMAAWFIEMVASKNYNLPTGEKSDVRWIKPDERNNGLPSQPPRRF